MDQTKNLIGAILAVIWPPTLRVLCLQALLLVAFPMRALQAWEEKESMLKIGEKVHQSIPGQLKHLR